MTSQTSSESVKEIIAAVLGAGAVGAVALAAFTSVVISVFFAIAGGLAVWFLFRKSTQS